MTTNYQLKVNGNVLGLFSESLPALEKAFKYIRSIKSVGSSEAGESRFAKVTIYEYHVDNPRKKRKDLFNDEVDIQNIKDSKLYRLLIKKRAAYSNNGSNDYESRQQSSLVNHHTSSSSLTSNGGRVKSVSASNPIENIVPMNESHKQEKTRGRKKEVTERVDNKVPIRRNRKSETIFEPRDTRQNHTTNPSSSSFTPSFLDDLLFSPQSSTTTNNVGGPKIRGKRVKQ